MIESSRTMSANKRFAVDALSAVAGARLREVGRRLADAYHPDAEWRGSHPLNEMQGVEAIEARVWSPLLHAFPDLERRDLLVAAGNYQGSDFVAAMGHYCGVSARTGSASRRPDVPLCSALARFTG